jgi:hypothetical protein
MASFDRPTYGGRERGWGSPSRRRASRNPRWEDEERDRASSERDSYFDFEGDAGERAFEPREDFSRRERDFGGGFRERDPEAWRRSGGRFEPQRGSRFGEGREGWGPGRGFEQFEDWQQPRRFESGRGVYGGTPEREAELRGGYPSRHGRGGYAGRGPKDFRRSDERLREEICEQLMADPDIDASELTVNVSDGEVTLEGSVEDRQMKRDAEDCAEGVLGVRQVHNRLRVESGGLGAAETGSPQRGQQQGSSEGQRGSRSTSKPV